MSETTAKAIRIITLPPIMALFLIILLKGYFPEGHDRMAIVLLCGLPLLSYLCWKAIPEQYAQGRTSQRKLAIIFSVVRYVLGLIAPKISTRTIPTGMMTKMKPGTSGRMAEACAST